jgi:hypothetical protein
VIDTCGCEPGRPPGTNVLVGTNRAALLHAIESILDNTFKPRAIPDLWAGHAAARIVDILRAQIGLPAGP